MATHSSILAWEIPGTEEPGRLQSMGSQESWTRLSTHASMHLLNYLTSILPNLIVKLMLQKVVPQIFCCFASSLHRIGLCRLQFEKCVVVYSTWSWSERLDGKTNYHYNFQKQQIIKSGSKSLFFFLFFFWLPRLEGSSFPQPGIEPWLQPCKRRIQTPGWLEHSPK